VLRSESTKIVKALARAALRSLPDYAYTGHSGVSAASRRLGQPRIDKTAWLRLEA
jgi:hypothetical protein